MFVPFYRYRIEVQLNVRKIPSGNMHTTFPTPLVLLTRQNVRMNINTISFTLTVKLGANLLSMKRVKVNRH